MPAMCKQQVGCDGGKQAYRPTCTHTQYLHIPPRYCCCCCCCRLRLAYRQLLLGGLVELDGVARDRLLVHPDATAGESRRWSLAGVMDAAAAGL